jgi:conjugative transfer region protein TrbK
MRAARIKAISRSIGYAAVAAAIFAAALHFRQHERKPLDPVGFAGASSTDRLARELAHCQALGTAAENDPSCASAWAENRRRFFGKALSPDAPAATAKPGQPQ